MVIVFFFIQFFTDVVKDTSDMSDESDASEYEPISTDEEAIVFECSSSSGMEVW